MNNFRNSGPGGPRNRSEFIGGRPKSEGDYRPKKRFDSKPSFGNNRGGDRKSFGGNRGNDRREVEMFKTTCTACGKTAEVPFRPDGSKPVLCRDCFANKPDDRGGFQKRERFSNDRPAYRPERSFEAPRSEKGTSPDYKALLAQVSALETKVNEILTILKPTPILKEKAEVDKDVSVKEIKPKKVAAKKAVEKVEKKAVRKVVEKAEKKPAKKVVKKAIKK